jgi:hypothetical protein
MDGLSRPMHGILVFFVFLYLLTEARKAPTSMVCALTKVFPLVQKSISATPPISIRGRPHRKPFLAISLGTSAYEPPLMQPF